MVALNKLEVLQVRRLPGRLTPLQAADLLGVQEHDIPVLIRARLLRPLGNPSQQATKYFASAEIERYRADVAWLDKASKALTQHWQDKNARRVKEDSKAVNLN